MSKNLKLTPKSAAFIQLEDDYGARNYKPLPVVLTKGEGVWLYDVDGNKYLDMMSAYSAVSHGHANPRLVKALTEQAAKLAVTSRAFYSDKLGPLLKKLCDITHLDKAIMANGGVEAVETAIKAIRRYGYQHKNIKPNCAKIIVASNNFHGRTLTVTSFSTEPAYKEGFGPFTPGFEAIPFGDAAAFEKAIDENTVAILIEPMQGEAGVLIPPKGYLQDIRKICDKHKVLMVLDEIQTGLGRTGKWFAYQHENILPDGVILGKALGGALLPVSAFVAKKEILDVFTPGSHGSTFGGNALACAVALEALNIIEDEGLVQKSAELGDFLLKSLQAIKSPLIRSVRGSGLWVGLELNSDLIYGPDFCLALMKEGILSKEAHETVIRFAPPLIIQKSELQWAIDKVKSTLSTLEEKLNSGATI